MMFELILGFALLFALVFAILTQGKMRLISARYKELLNAKSGDVDRLSTLRNEIGMLKEDVARKNQQLADSREQLKKKARKEAKQETANEEVLDSGIDVNEETQRLKLALRAMETQVNLLQAELSQSETAHMERVEKKYAGQVEDLKNQVRQLQAEARSQNDSKKKLARMATVLSSLEQLPEDVVSELARLARKAEHHEKLHSLVRGKLKMSQERFLELQKRYFAVCRELALTAGKDTAMTDEEARLASDQIVEEKPTMDEQKMEG